MKSLLPFALAGLAMLLWTLVVFSRGFSRLMGERSLSARVARLLTWEGLKETNYLMAACLAVLIHLAPAGPVVAYRAWERQAAGASVVEGVCGCSCAPVEAYHPLARMWPEAEPLRALAFKTAATRGTDGLAAATLEAFAGGNGAMLSSSSSFGARERNLLKELGHADEAATPERNGPNLAMAAALKAYIRDASAAGHAEVAETAKEVWQRHLGRMGSQVKAAYCRVRVDATHNVTGEAHSLDDVPDVSRHDTLQAISRSASWHSDDYAAQRWRLLEAAAAAGGRGDGGKEVAAIVEDMEEHEVAHEREARSWMERTCADDFEPVQCFGVLNHHTGRLEDLVAGEEQYAAVAADRLTELPSAWSIFVDTSILLFLSYNLLSALNIMPWLSEVFGDEEEEEEEEKEKGEEGGGEKKEDDGKEDDAPPKPEQQKKDE